MRVSDNCNYASTDLIACAPNLGHQVVDQSLEQLVAAGDFLIYPDLATLRTRASADMMILKQVGDRIQTSNLIGFIGYGDEELTIHSRFDRHSDYFLQYMLQRLQTPNLVNLPTGSNDQASILDLLQYLLPKYLLQALSKGIFREYQTNAHHDSHVTGVINVGQFLRHDLPFAGRVSYRTRDRVSDNTVMALIRHTIEFVLTQPAGKSILTTDPTIREAVAVVRQATPQFDPQSRARVINQNLTHPVVSAYFEDYHELQKLCLAILRHERLGIGGRHDQLYGVIFDVAWLWENYVAALLGDAYQHPDNRQHLGMVPIFQGDDGLPGEMSGLFPDFYSPARRQVADTKYKFGVNGIQREDLFQLITYAHILKAKCTGIIYPDLAQTTQFKLGELNGFGGVVYKQSLQVPQAAKSYGQFVNAMLAEESQLKTEMIAR